MPLYFVKINSYYVIENIFELIWQFDLQVLLSLSLGIGLVTLILIMLTNLKYLSPKVYPLIRNQ
jgi:putative ABC transport system permease protein